MTDPSAPAVPATWADVAQDALHYAMATAIVAMVGLFAWYGKVSQDLLVVTITGAAGLVGMKLNR